MFIPELELSGNVFFTSDTHFGHEKALRLFQRPFQSVEEMNETIIDRINKTTKKDDILIHLGDFAGDRTPVKQCREYFKKLDCENIYFLFGNHDSSDLYLLGFQDTFQQVSAKINDQYIFLNHYMMTVWNKSHYGSWHLYGHTHGTAEETVNRLMPGRKAMDVGIDTHPEFRPYSFDEIKCIIGPRPGYDPSGFLRVT